MSKTRVYELAKILKVTSKEIISKANELNIAVKSHSSSLDEDALKLITDAFATKPQIKNNTSATIKITLKDKEQTSLNEHIQKAFNELRNIEDLASLINKVNKTIYEHTHKIKVKHLTYHAYHSKDKYQVFKIPKKSGGEREIYSPSKGLKYILKTLNIIFQALYKPQSVAHGFLPNRSVVTNAKLHVNKNYVYNIDLENFFPNIHQARIWKRLQHPPFNLNGKRIEIANLLANLVCFQYEKSSNEKNFLPQGAPTSPMLSNIICHRLDKKLLELAKAYNVKYTRYADDMTFSSDHNVYQKNSEFLQKLFSIIQSENFKINPKKIRLQKRGYKQEVTGLIVNEKINVSRSYIKNTRALIHLVEKYGDEKAQKIFVEKNGSKNLDLVIFGKLQYLKMVKGSEDSTYTTLYQKAMNAYKMIEVEVTKSNNDEKKQTEIIKKNTINEQHNPKELVKILRNFTTCEKPPCALKAAVHSEEEYYQFNGYEDYIRNLKSAWRKIDNPLRNLSKRLHGKIYAFLFASDLGTQERVDKSKSKNSGWGDSGMTFG
ncbi:MAG: translation initiation factor IF-2 N-terminal domain-containing protein, partial [Campylobacterales bacterium]|nr:translation initiation factor IF-2 N-terminal domain-containing protein [Campylobacterales bacterium]